MADEDRPKVAKTVMTAKAAGTNEGDEMSSPKLVVEATREAMTLVRSEIELAKAEVKADLHGEIVAAKGLGVAAVAALATLTLLLVAAAFGLSRTMPDWAAALVV